MWLVFSPSWLWCDVAVESAGEELLGTMRTERPLRFKMDFSFRASVLDVLAVAGGE